MNSRRLTSIAGEKAIIEFVEEAARTFEERPELVSYSTGELRAGCHLALRWGLGNDCVMVVKLDEDFQPVIYQNEIRRENK